MDTLYIIGNGFDLHHGLNTSYKSFGFYLKEKNSVIYNYLVDNYGLPYLYDKNIDYYEWNEFEKALADLDYESVLNENSDFLPNLASDEFRDRDWHAFEQVMDGIVEDLTVNLFNEFKNFIQSVEFPQKSKKDLLILDSNALFLSFNYTDTLERYYNILPQDILYIHNKAFSQDVLILGHGTNPEDFVIESKKMPEGLSIEDQEEWNERMADEYDFSYENGRKTLMRYFSESFKYTESIISNSQAFFNKLTNVKTVYVLGQSISEIDQPYFLKIIESINDKNIKWIASYYNNKQTIFDNMKSIGLNDNQIELVRLDNLKVKC